VENSLAQLRAHRAAPAVLRRVAELKTSAACASAPADPVEGTGSILSEAVNLGGRARSRRRTHRGGRSPTTAGSCIRPAQGIGEIPARDWADFVHIRTIAEANVPGYTMITPYENVTGGDPLFLHFYEMDTDQPETAFRSMTPLVEELLNVGLSYADDTGPINDIINRSHDVDGVFWRWPAVTAFGTGADPGSTPTTIACSSSLQATRDSRRARVNDVC
jgi:hypothetical protein